MKDRTFAALLGAGAVISAAAIRDGISRAIDRSLVGEALDREEPKAAARMLSRLKGSTEETELEEQVEKARIALEQRPHETVELTARDGTRLAGHLFQNPQAKRIVLAMHGWRSAWARDFGLVSDFLLEEDCTVLYAEQRGQGGSDGTYMSFGMLERFDCVDWAQWLAEKYPGKPLYLAGISMGAATVLMASGEPDLPEQTAGILADCGFTSAREEWKHISEHNLGIPFDAHLKHVDSLCRKRIDLDSDAYSTLDAMEKNRVPVLFVHGTADTFVPLEMTLRNYEACKAPKKLLTVEGANHGMSYLRDRAAYEAAVREFFSMCEEK